MLKVVIKIKFLFKITAAGHPRSLPRSQPGCPGGSAASPGARRPAPGTALPGSEGGRALVRYCVSALAR
jgi:hypothetical protein